MEATGLQPVARKPKSKRRQSRNEKAMIAERAAQKSRIYNLTLDVNALKQEIAQLMLCKQALETRALLCASDSNGSCTKKARCFFQLFRYGYIPHRTTAAIKARGFVNVFIDPGVALGTSASGALTLLAQWERYTGVFDGFEHKLREATVVMPECGSKIVECHSVFGGRIVQQLIDVVFPHVRRNKALIQRLIGKQLWCPAITQLYFNNEGKIVRYDATADFFTGFQQLLSDDVLALADLMDHATIEDESMIGEQLTDDDMGIEELEVRNNAAETMEESTKQATSIQDNTIGKSPPNKHSIAFIVS